MDVSWTIILSVAVLVIALIIYIIMRNLKDARELEQKIIDEEKSSLPKEDNTEVESND